MSRGMDSLAGIFDNAFVCSIILVLSSLTFLSSPQPLRAHFLSSWRLWRYASCRPQQSFNPAARPNREALSEETTMNRQLWSIVGACALGACIGTFTALDISTRFQYGSYLWGIGALLGGIVAYVAVDFRHFGLSKISCWSGQAKRLDISSPFAYLDSTFPLSS